MSRETRNSRGTSSAQALLDDPTGAQDNLTDTVEEQDALIAAAMAQQEAQMAAAEAANLVDGVISPAARRLLLITQVNAKNLASERQRKIAKGLLILQSKISPFVVEDMLNKNDMQKRDIRKA
jgi:hypothetical protein